MKRYKRGENAPQSLLTESDVMLIREIGDRRRDLLDELSLISSRKLAEKFEVSHSTIRAVLSSKNWKHI